ncbi:peptidoglycan-binding protein [Streptomyces sp. NPDC127098]|uniref:peptidoglycan-binding domain-containing protein n=1 Tax=Streptomyces sp. NPDC127098 TaxID=3347137 RepID=UPI00365ACC3A
MKPYARKFVNLSVIAGIAVGCLGATGGAVAAPAASPVVSSEAAAPLAVVNLSLSAEEARRVQLWLRDWGYTGPIDGLLGTESWMALQRFLRSAHGYGGPIDGIVGPETVMALQRWMRTWDYDGPIDGIAGPGTQAAFKLWARTTFF